MKTVRKYQEQSIKSVVRTFLKEKTSTLHQQAEEALQARGQIETQSGLSHFLNGMLKAQSQFRMEYDHACVLAGLQAQSDKLIHALGTDLGLEQEPVAQAHALDDHFCLGVGYVFEGSALGASVLKKRLIRSNNVCPRYLRILTDTAHSRWPQYVETLDNYREKKPILAGAEAVFNFIIVQAETSQ